LVKKNRPLDFYKTRKKKQENSCQLLRFSEFGNNHDSLAKKGENLIDLERFISSPGSSFLPRIDEQKFRLIFQLRP